MGLKIGANVSVENLGNGGEGEIPEEKKSGTQVSCSGKEIAIHRVN